MNLERSTEVLDRHGAGVAAKDLALRVFARATGLEPIRFLAWAFGERPGLGASAGGDGARWLHRDELEAFAADDELDLPLDFVREALALGHRFAGVVAHGDLLSYEVFALEPTAIPEGLVVSFPTPFAYVYKAFTRPGARGRGHHGRVTRFAAAELSREGVRGMVAYCRAINHASLAAFRRLGFRGAGWACLARDLPGFALQPPAWARRGSGPRVRLVATAGSAPGGAAS